MLLGQGVCYYHSSESSRNQPLVILLDVSRLNWPILTLTFKQSNKTGIGIMKLKHHSNISFSFTANMKSFYPRQAMPLTRTPSSTQIYNLFSRRNLQKTFGALQGMVSHDRGKIVGNCRENSMSYTATHVRQAAKL